MKKQYKRSDLLREGYVKGLKEARRIISEALESSTHNQMEQVEAAKRWAADADECCEGGGKHPHPELWLWMLQKNYDGSLSIRSSIEETILVYSVTYDEAADRFVFVVDGGKVYLNRALEALQYESVYGVSVDRFEVDFGRGGVAPLTEYYADAYGEDPARFAKVEFVGFPKFRVSA